MKLYHSYSKGAKDYYSVSFDTLFKSKCSHETLLEDG